MGTNPAAAAAARPGANGGRTPVRHHRCLDGIFHVLLVLLGLPIPNVDDFKEEGQAFLYDSGPLAFDWREAKQHLEMRDGQKVAVEVGGYWTEPVASYSRQKCRFGLHQALHRIRPYIEHADERHIFIFTNMPIPGVKVDYLMRDQQGEQIAERLQRAIGILNGQLNQRKRCTVPKLGRLLASDGEVGRTVNKWIGENATK